MRYVGGGGVCAPGEVVVTGVLGDMHFEKLVYLVVWMLWDLG